MFLKNVIYILFIIISLIQSCSLSEGTLESPKALFIDSLENGAELDSVFSVNGYINEEIKLSNIKVYYVHAITEESNSLNAFIYNGTNFSCVVSVSNQGYYKVWADGFGEGKYFKSKIFLVKVKSGLISSSYPESLIISSLTNTENIISNWIFIIDGYIENKVPLSIVTVYLSDLTGVNTNIFVNSVINGNKFSTIISLSNRGYFKIWAIAKDTNNNLYKSKNFIIKMNPTRTIKLLDGNGNEIRPDHSFTGDYYTNDSKGFCIVSGNFYGFNNPKEIRTYYVNFENNFTNIVKGNIVNSDNFTIVINPEKDGFYIIWVEIIDSDDSITKSYYYKLKFTRSRIIDLFDGNGNYITADQSFTGEYFTNKNNTFFSVSGKLYGFISVSNIKVISKNEETGKSFTNYGSLINLTNFSVLISTNIKGLYTIWVEVLDIDNTLTKSYSYRVLYLDTRTIDLFDNNENPIPPSDSFSGYTYTNENSDYFIATGKLNNFISPINTKLYIVNNSKQTTNQYDGVLINPDRFSVIVKPEEQGLYTLWIEVIDIDNSKTISYLYKIYYIPKKHPEIYKYYLITGLTNKEITNNTIVDTIETNLDTKIVIHIKLPQNYNIDDVNGVYLSVNNSIFNKIENYNYYYYISNNNYYLIVTNSLELTNNMRVNFSSYVIDKDNFISKTNTITNVYINVKILDKDNIFVATYGNDTNEGTIQNPLKTLQKAIKYSKIYNIKNIKVQEGIYNIDEFSSESNIIIDISNTTIIGGWNSNFTNISGKSILSFNLNNSTIPVEINGIYNTMCNFNFINYKITNNQSKFINIKGDFNIFTNNIISNNNSKSILNISSSGNNIENIFLNNNSGDNNYNIEISGNNNKISGQIYNNNNNGINIIGNYNNINIIISNNGNLVYQSDGINITGKYNTIEGDIIRNSGNGIIINGEYNNIKNINIISNGYSGIIINGCRNLIEAKLVFNGINQNIGVVIFKNSYSSNNTIQNSIISNNNGVGIYFMNNSGGTNIIKDSTIIMNTSEDKAGGVYIEGGIGHILDTIFVSKNTNLTTYCSGIFIGKPITIRGSTIKFNKSLALYDIAIELNTDAFSPLIIRNNTISGSTNVGTYGIYESTSCNGHILTGNTFDKNYLEYLYYDSTGYDHDNDPNTPNLHEYTNIEQVNKNKNTGANGGSGLANPLNSI